MGLPALLSVLDSVASAIWVIGLACAVAATVNPGWTRVAYGCLAAAHGVWCLHSALIGDLPWALFSAVDSAFFCVLLWRGRGGGGKGRRFPRGASRVVAEMVGRLRPSPILTPLG